MARFERFSRISSREKIARFERFSKLHQKSEERMARFKRLQQKKKWLVLKEFQGFFKRKNDSF